MSEQKNIGIVKLLILWISRSNHGNNIHDEAVQREIVGLVWTWRKCWGQRSMCAFKIGYAIVWECFLCEEVSQQPLNPGTDYTLLYERNRERLREGSQE